MWQTIGLIAQQQPATAVLGEVQQHGLFNGPVWIATGLAMVICVTIHYEVIRLLLVIAQRFSRSMRVLLPALILCLIFAHMLEIGVYAVAYWCLSAWFESGVGGMEGDFDGSLSDLLYFSASVFTTVGFGDITPHGPIRTLVATEALTGFVMITWSASFTFLIMQRYLGRLLHHDPPEPHA